MTDYSSSTDIIPELKNSVLAKSSSPPRWVFQILGEIWWRLLWTTGIAFLLFTVAAFLIPVRYEGVARLMPPDQSGSANGLMGALMANGGDLFASLGSGAFGLHTSGATVVGILHSRTVQDDL